MGPSQTARILVVDDSVVARRIISEILDDEEGFEVVGTAANGRIALAKIPRLKPDLITLDVEMPEMDGLEALSRIRADFPSIKVVMLSNLTRQGGVATVESLFRGASDYVTKASQMESPEAARTYLREQLVPKINALVGRAGTSSRSRRQKVTVEPISVPIGIVVIGVSTGGPNALRTVLGAIPSDFEVPIVIVQHMPPDFTRSLAERLDTLCNIRVFEGRTGARVNPGTAWVAPGDRHMEVVGGEEGLTLVTRMGPLENSCRPAVDVLMRSVAEHYGPATLAVILTGMGQDGLAGCRAIGRAGGHVVAQDEATSVVWGMPGQVVRAGLAQSILPVEEIGSEIVRCVRSSRT